MAASDDTNPEDSAPEDYLAHVAKISATTMITASNPWTSWMPHLQTNGTNHLPPYIFHLHPPIGAMGGGMGATAVPIPTPDTAQEEVLRAHVTAMELKELLLDALSLITRIATSYDWTPEEVDAFEGACRAQGIILEKK